MKEVDGMSSCRGMSRRGRTRGPIVRRSFLSFVVKTTIQFCLSSLPFCVPSIIIDVLTEDHSLDELSSILIFESQSAPGTSHLSVDLLECMLHNRPRRPRKPVAKMRTPVLRTRIVSVLQKSVLTLRSAPYVLGPGGEVVALNP